MQQKHNEFGCLVIGPSGSGKTTFCNGLQQFLNQIQRKCCLINLDPANDQISYECDIDIKQLIELQDIMEETQLGPNGALVYCFQFLESNIKWLIDQMTQFRNHYFIFDFPGQIELYINNLNIKNIIGILQNEGFQICSISLFESLNCYDSSKYLQCCIYRLPHINILSKIDLIKHNISKLNNRLEHYLEANELDMFLFPVIDDNKLTKLDKKIKKMNEIMMKLNDDFGLSSFIPLMIESKQSMCYLLSHIDKSNGYFYDHSQQSEKYTDIRNQVYQYQNINPTEFYMDLEEQLFDKQEAEDQWDKDIQELKNQK